MSVARIAEILHNAYAAEPWHGYSIEVILKDVTPEEAAARPVKGAHSILELVLHMAAWAGEAAARAEGRMPQPPQEGDYPAAEGVSWSDARDRLAKAHAHLMEVVTRFPPERLGEMVGATRDAPLGTGVSFERLLIGVAEHDAYHGGQVSLLKKALRG